MNRWNLDTPVVIIIYRRPETTKRVFNEIAKAEPPELFVIADGPQEGQEEDHKKCQEARAVIDVSWECEVYKNYADTNLGLRKRIPSGLNWVFEHVDEAIILEDDCLPNQDFFRFSERMLEEYRGDKRIMNITGTNYLSQWKSDTQDYHFSVYGGIWGWATWDRVWELYDPDMERWEDTAIRQSVHDVIADEKQYHWRKNIFDRVYEGKVETWAYQWAFSRLINSGLTIVPSKNLITNIGFGGEATNTTSKVSYANLPRHNIDFPVATNQFVAPDRSYDQKYYELRKDSLLRRNMKKLYYMLIE